MYVLAFLNCESCNSRTDHEIDTRSGEATCTTDQADHTLEPAALLALLEDA